MVLPLTSVQLFLVDYASFLTLSPFLLLSTPLLLPLPLTSSSQVSPDDHPAGNFEFDVLIGADGRRSTIPGFDRKELRGKLALAITANFINYFTREEAGVEEISGVAFIFNQKFFKVRCVVSVRGWVGEVVNGRCEGWKVRCVMSVRWDGR